MNFEEWYAKLGEWINEDNSRYISYATRRHLARHLEEWEASRPTTRAGGRVCTCPNFEHNPIDAEICGWCGLPLSTRR